jgi:hypothetical protein
VQVCAINQSGNVQPFWLVAYLPQQHRLHYLSSPHSILGTGK